MTERHSATTSRPDWAPSNPKVDSRAHSSWYRYYAGYSRSFVQDVLARLDLPSETTVLDPWNGAGTTTDVVADRGHSVVGFDANPALVLVARGRLLGPDIAPSIDALAKDVLGHAKDIEHDLARTEAEPLRQWFDVGTASRLRSIEVAIQRTLVSDDRDQPLEPRDVGDVSRLAALFYVGLFAMVRSLVGAFRTSNPTWLKTPAADDALVGAEWTDLREAMNQSVAQLTRTIAVRSPIPDQRVTIAQANSILLPLGDGSVDATITSPPYLTRIDYVIATLPELAVLGYSKPAIRRLRETMIGTPTVSGPSPQPSKAWGRSAIELLAKVEGHPSRASGTYYLRWIKQYLAAMWESLVQVRRVSRSSAPLVVVVQDSYYKELHVDLPTILSEMIRGLGWSQIRRVDYPVLANRAAINPESKKYRVSFDAVESVLICR